MPRPNNKSATGETDVSLNDSPIDADRRTWGRGANTGIVPRSVTTSSPSVPPDRFDGKTCLLHPSVVLEPAFADHHSRIRPFRNFQTGMVVDQEWLEGVSFADLGGHDVLRKEGALCDELLSSKGAPDAKAGIHLWRFMQLTSKPHTSVFCTCPA